MREFEGAFSALKAILERHAGRLGVKTDSPVEYTVNTKAPSPFPQHKGQPMFFGSVRLGKAYASFHLMPLYMCEKLTSTISAPLKKTYAGEDLLQFQANSRP